MYRHVKMLLKRERGLQIKMRKLEEKGQSRHRQQRIHRQRRATARSCQILTDLPEATACNASTN